MDDAFASFYKKEILKQGPVVNQFVCDGDYGYTHEVDDFDYVSEDDIVHETINLDEDDVVAGKINLNYEKYPTTPIQVSDNLPYEGMTFSSLEEADAFYKKYAEDMGFEVRIKSRRKSTKTKNYCSCAFQCKRAGKTDGDDGSEDSDDEPMTNPNDKGKGIATRSRRRDPHGGSGCKARMFVSLKRSGLWTVTRFEPTHNHAMVSPAKKTFLCSRRKVTPVAKQLIDVCRKANIGASKIWQIFQNQSGGIENVGMSLRDIENVIRDFRKDEFDPNDAEGAICYLKRQHDESAGNFFYRVCFDEENRIKCLVWIDGRCRHSYKLFGDVVAFDTTYRTNRYKMPFAPFTGVNHHYHSILFGFALLCNEKEETFDWVFNSWLEGMDGNAPRTIITDQDIAMGNSIRKVFPYTQHHLCVWHITQKYPIRLGPLLQVSQFKHDFDRCVKKSLTIQVFEERWSALVETYSLQGHEWLMEMYCLRHQWVPAFTRRFFTAGMCSTQRSESMNSAFDQYVNSCTGLKDFMVKTEEALGKQFHRERKEDYNTKYFKRQLVHKTALEIHGAEVYTKNIFKMLQDEIGGSNQFSCVKYREGCNDMYKVYHLRNEVKGNNDSRIYTVMHYLHEDAYRCSCQKHESSGMICRHIIRYLEQKNVREIPASLISERWSRDANATGGDVQFQGSSNATDYTSSQSMRYNHLCQLYQGLSLDASMTSRGYEHALQSLIEQRTIIASFPLEEVSQPMTSPIVQCQSDAFQHGSGGNDIFHDIHSVPVEPEVVVTKGRRKEKRLKSGMEKAGMSKPLRKCRLCGTLTNHDSRNHYKVLGLEQP